MTKETEAEVERAFRLAIEWKAFKLFCLSRTTCKGCPYYEKHVCSAASTESVLKQIAEVGKQYFYEHGISM